MARPTSKKIGNQLSTKHLLIDKANSYLVISSALATVIVVFSIFASIELVDKISYQNMVIGYREDALEQLEKNKKSIGLVKKSYVAFEDSPESIIGTADKNSKIILDSLPSKYDFPAFITSVGYLIQLSGMQINGIEGNDQEVEAIKSSINPTAVDIPFSLSATGNYESAQKLIDIMYKSIRPFNISSIELTGDDNIMEVSITGISYYQPTKEIGINEQTVKTDEEFKLDDSQKQTTESSTSGATQ